MQTAIIILSIVALAIIVIAIVILMGKGDDLIAGYNTATFKTRKDYDIKRLRIVFGVMRIFIGLTLPAFGLVLVMGYADLLVLMVFIGVIFAAVITTLILANTWAKKKVEWDGKKVKKPLNAICLPLLAGGMLFALAGCSSYKMAPFASGSDWSLKGNTVTSVKPAMSVNFGGDNIAPLSNMSDGDYNLHFIASDEAFARYSPECRKFVTDVLKKIPLQFESVELMLADQFIVLTPAVANAWMPDMVLQADGASYVVEANPVAGAVQPHDQLWRNVITDKRSKRITVVDRFVKDGHHYVIVYVLQSQTSKLPFVTAAHFDVTNPCNVQAVGTWLESLMHISEKAWHDGETPHRASRGD